MANDNSKLLNLTNNSGRDLVAALATTADETASSNAVVAPNGELEVLKTASGSTVIKNKSTDAVTLDRSYTGDSTGAVQDYDLQLCDSTWLYPFTALSVAQQNGNGAAGFAPQTVTNGDGAAMSQAALFYQTLAAYPHSALTQNYLAAIEGAKEAALAKADGSPGSAAAVAAAIEDAVAQFFKSTMEYKDVTLADVAAVDNYYNNFPAVWAQYQDNITYYLYGSDGEKAVFAGTLSLQKTGNLDVTKEAGGYTCSFAPAVDGTNTTSSDVDEAKAVTLTYADGLFVDDAKASAPAIALKGTFLLERLFTDAAADETGGDGEENNNIIVVLAGTVNNIACIGFDTDQSQFGPNRRSPVALPSGLGSDQQYWDRGTDAKNQLDAIVSLLTLLSFVLLIPTMNFAVYYVLKAIKARARLKEALEQKIVETKWSDMTTAQQEALRETGVKLLGPNKDIYVQPNPNNAEAYYKVLRYDFYNNKLLRALSEQNVCCETLMTYLSMMDAADRRQLGDLLNSIAESSTTLATCPRTELESRVPVELQKIRQYDSLLSDMAKEIKTQMAEDAQEIVDNSLSISGKQCSNVERSLENEAHETEETDPKVEREYVPFEWKPVIGKALA